MEYGIEFIACQPIENLVKRNTRHEDILVPQSVIRIRVPMVYVRDWGKSM